MTMETHAQVERYLAEVDAALAARGVVDRDDIVAGLREHIADASSTDGGRSQAEVLRELGDPQLIAEAATGPDAQRAPSSAAPAGTRTTGRPWFAAVALGLVFFGALLGVLSGWIVLSGVVVVGWLMMWVSSVWTPVEKLAGTLLVPAPGIALWVVVGFAISAEECTTTSTGLDVQTVCTGGGGDPLVGILATIVLVTVILVGVTTSIRLLRRATRG